VRRNGISGINYTVVTLVHTEEYMLRTFTRVGLESDGGDRFFCGGGTSGEVRAVRRPKRGSSSGKISKARVDSTRK